MPPTSRASAVFPAQLSKTQNSSKAPNFLWKFAISTAVLIHFFLLCLSYSANHVRSIAQDKILERFQTYLIGCNFYQESLPVEWIQDENGPLSTQVSILANDVDNWTPVVSSKPTFLESLSLHGLKSRRILQLMTALSKNDDKDGILRILKSIAIHLKQSDSSLSLKKIRLELPSILLADGSSESVNVEASIATFDDGEIGLVPQIESHRSVRSKVNDTNP